nr:Rib/alpha-like domain-containing protein [Corynebacterium coyleae]
MCKIKSDDKGALESCNFQAPEDLKETTVYTAALVSVDPASGKPSDRWEIADSFTAVVPEPLPLGSVGTEFPNNDVTPLFKDLPDNMKEGTEPSYSANDLPAGLAIDPKTGKITGKPTTPGTTEVIVTREIEVMVEQDVPVLDDDDNPVYENPDEQDPDKRIEKTEKKPVAQKRKEQVVTKITVTDTKLADGVVGEPYAQDVKPEGFDKLPQGFELKKDSIKVEGLPEGLEFKDGTITGTPKKTVDASEEKPNVSVTYTLVDQDGKETEHTDLVPLKVTDQASKYDPQGKDQEVAKNAEPKAEDSIANKEAVVVVTYPDGTTDEVPVTVKVAKDQAEQHDPQGKDQTVETGKRPDPKDNVKDADKLPEGTTFKYKEDPDTSTAGDKPVTVIVTYPDGSTDEVQATVKVEDPKPAEDPTPEPEQPQPEQPQPEPTPEPEQPQPEQPQPEDPKQSDADIYEPQVQDKTVAPNEVPEAKDHVTNIDELPEGTAFEYEQAPDTSTEGDKPVTIVATYPDGTTDKVNANVKVQKNATDADKHDPQGQDQKVKTGGTPDPKGNIKDADSLPEGTTFKYKETPDTSKPGVYDVTVVVTYPDGSTDEVQTTITVGTDAERFVPEYDKVTDVPVDGEKNTNDPFGTKAPVKNTEAKPTADSDADKWEFTPQDNGVINAKAPSMKDVAEKVEAHLPEIKSTDAKKRWDKFFETFKPFARPSVAVGFTYEDDSTNSATANFDLVGKDGKSLLDPNGDFDGDGHTNREEVENGANPADDQSKPDTTAPTIDDIIPGAKTITGKGDRPGETIIVTWPNGKTITTTTGKDGKWKVNVPADVNLKTGDETQVVDGAGNKATAKVGIDTGKCVATSVGFGLPLIALLPIGLATQIQIPGLTEFAAQANAQIQTANTRLQQQLGVFNPQIAAQADAVNAKLAQYGTDIATVVGGLALIAAGILAGTIIYDNCSPNGGSSVKNLELKGSSGNTYAGSSKETTAPEKK